MSEPRGHPAAAVPGDDLAQRLSRLSSRLLADAEAVDASENIPAEHLHALAAAGLYGMFAPVAEGGLGLGYIEICAVIEELASCCLPTTFLLAQHFRLLGAMLDPATPPAIREAMLARTIRGETKGGVALTGLLPGPSALHAMPAPGGWLLDGAAPWVSGWGIVDVICVFARGPAGPQGETVVTLLLDGRPQKGLSVTPLRLSALNATRTVRLGFAALFVAEDNVIGLQPYEIATRESEMRLRLNGSFPLGVAGRCCALLGPSPLDDELRDCRASLDAADDSNMAAARAAACELAARAAHVLVVSRGSRAALVGDPAERLSREAAFLLIFGSRPAIKDALLKSLEARSTVR
ncbi:MAG TPA: acyl-CoA dehydrogenase family protein [Acidimicrobiales bacterium]|nr:acyl-CoA dehydrogenase family protein [Acidimicrobiales bacterium]